MLRNKKFDFILVLGVFQITVLVARAMAEIHPGKTNGNQAPDGFIIFVLPTV